MAPSVTPAPENGDLSVGAISSRPSNGHANGHSNGNGHSAKATEATNAANATIKAPLAELDASKLVYHYTTSPRPLPDDDTAYRGTETVCTDHMITCSWSASTGWGTPELKPYGPLTLMPTASCLHYGTECFEGLKVYRGYDGKLRVFRPRHNAERFLMSSLRISLPGFPVADMEALIMALPAVDGARWLDRPGYLYIRPAIIGTSPQLGVTAPHQALLFITLSFMPNLSANPLRLETSPADTVRAWVGGFGHAKVGANYGPSLAATRDAKTRGFAQILWLYGPEGLCTEAGASNFFVVWRPRHGGALQLVTAPIDDRLILDGITRKSVLALARERLAGELEVVERRYSIDEVLEAGREGRLVEAFASGTAYFVCAVEAISHKGELVDVPLGKGGMGKYTATLRRWVMDIQYGQESHPWGVVIEERKP